MEENKNLDKNQNDALSDDDLDSVSGGGFLTSNNIAPSPRGDIYGHNHVNIAPIRPNDDGPGFVSLDPSLSGGF